MDKLGPLSKVAGIVGIVFCIIAVAGRFYGEAEIFGFQAVNLFLSGVGGMAFGNWLRLETLGLPVGGSLEKAAPLSKIAGIIGVVFCIISVAGRFYGEAEIFGFQAVNLFASGVGGLVFANWLKSEATVASAD
ncbi:MAG: hypothetical protein AAF533_21380 [Acidobacteriota bacterium]